MIRTYCIFAVLFAATVAVSAPPAQAGGRCYRGGACGPMVSSYASFEFSSCGIPVIYDGGSFIPGDGEIIPGPGGEIIPGPGGEIIPGPGGQGGGGEIIPGPGGATGMRTWVYGDRPRLVIGTYRGVESGRVALQRQSGELVRVPLQELSATDQKLVVSQIVGHQRVWTDSSEQYTRRAQFERTERQVVVLKSANGKEITIPFARLSEADRVVVRILSPAVVRDQQFATPSGTQLVRR